MRQLLHRDVDGLGRDTRIPLPLHLYIVLLVLGLGPRRSQSCVGLARGPLIIGHLIEVGATAAVLFIRAQTHPETRIVIVIVTIFFLRVLISCILRQLLQLSSLLTLKVLTHNSTHIPRTPGSQLLLLQTLLIRLLILCLFLLLCKFLLLCVSS